MPTVKCKNKVLIKGAPKSCDKFLIILPASVIHALKDNPQDKITTRCHDCPGKTKWVDIYYDSQKGFVWEVHSGDVVFDDEMHFDDVINYEIGG